MGEVRKMPKYLICIEWKNSVVQRTYTTSAKPRIEDGMIHITMWINNGRDHEMYGFNLSELSMYSVTPIIEGAS